MGVRVVHANATMPRTTSVARMEWKMKNAVMQKILDHGGVVFGGAVRDKYLHDVHADAFYDRCGLDEDVQCKYEDRTFLPELFGRWVIPRDIDAVVAQPRVDDLVRDLAQAFGKVRKVFDRDPSDYFVGVDRGLAARHVRLEVVPFHAWNARMLRRGIQQQLPVAVREEYPELALLLQRITHQAQQLPSIQVDLMVAEGTDLPTPPFGAIDFRCNALLMDKAGIHLSPRYRPAMTMTQRMRVLSTILQEIEAQKAVVAGPTEWYRICKMRDKGWTVVGCFQHIRTVRDAEYTGHCIICHDALHDGEWNLPFHCKLTCCDARYHVACLVDAMEKGEHAMQVTHECIMCKHALGNVQNDGMLLQAAWDAGKGEDLEVLAAPRG